MFGIRNIWRFAALVAFGAVVAPVTAAPTQPTSIQASPSVVVQVSPALNYATFSVKTSRASRITISLGTDRANLISKEVSKFATSHRARLTPLAPATKYYYNVVAMDKSKKLVGRRIGSLHTGSIRPAVMSVVNGRFRLNGVPFFPIMGTAYTECPPSTVITEYVLMGINVVDYWRQRYCRNLSEGSPWVTPEELHTLVGGRVWWMDRTSRTHSSPHAPPAPSMESLPELLRLNGQLEMDVMSGSLWGCGAGEDSAAEIYTRLRANVERQTKAGRAIVPLMFLLPDQAPGGSKGCLTGQKFAVDFWVSVLAGTGGIEYETQYPSKPSGGIAVDPEIRKRALLESNKLKHLYPVILSGRSTLGVSSSKDILTRSWSWGGSTYTVAVNTENKSVTAAFKWPGKKTGTVKALWEGRSTKQVSGGGISERFKPHQVHIYQLR